MLLARAYLKNDLALRLLDTLTACVGVRASEGQGWATAAARYSIAARWTRWHGSKIMLAIHGYGLH